MKSPPLAFASPIPRWMRWNGDRLNHGQDLRAHRRFQSLTKPTFPKSPTISNQPEKQTAIRSLVLVATITISLNSKAAPVRNSATGTDLTDGASWGCTAPISADTVTWISSSLGAGLALGSSESQPDTTATFLGESALSPTRHQRAWQFPTTEKQRFYRLKATPGAP